MSAHGINYIKSFRWLGTFANAGKVFWNFAISAFSISGGHVMEELFSYDIVFLYAGVIGYIYA